MSSIPSAAGSDVTTTRDIANQRQQHPLVSLEHSSLSPILQHPNNRTVSNSLHENNPPTFSADYSTSNKGGPVSTYGNSNYPVVNSSTMHGASDVDFERQRYIMQTATAAKPSSPHQSRVNPSNISNASGLTDPTKSSATSSSPTRLSVIGQPIPSPQQMLQTKQQQQLHQLNLQQLQRSQYQKQQDQLPQQSTEASTDATITSRHSPQKYGLSNAVPYPSHPSGGDDSLSQRNMNGSNAAQVHTMTSSSQQPFQINPTKVPEETSRMQPPGGQPSNVPHDVNRINPMTSHHASISPEAAVPPVVIEATSSVPLSTAKIHAPLINSKTKQASSSNLSDKSSSNAGGLAGAAQLPTEQVVGLLARCNWIDKTIWASRQLLGGQSVNGFMRATATVQRIKKQRARQNVRSGKKVATAAGAVATVAPGGDSGTPSTAAPATLSLEEQQAEEEILKKEVMTARTAKKIKQELDAGIQFCVVLHDAIRSIIQHMDNSIPPIEPLNSSSMSRSSVLTGMSIPSTSVPQLSPQPMQNGTLEASKMGNSKKPFNSPNAFGATVKAPTPPPPSPLNQSQARQGSSSQTSPSNSTGSTLRRYRKTKIPASGEVLIQLPEIDEVTGKRHSTKKDHPHRLSDVIRYRALRKGDPVAARISSRDLWILACIVKDYPGVDMTPLEFLRLSDARREQLFKEKVLIQDVEERDGGIAAAVLVSRSRVLPLPRSIAEAAEWGNYYRFFKKGSRVYAMYPNTTALYTATVVDCTTYCLGDEDVVVVEFDGDEPDAVTGKMPACHIPARFVTLIPKEFPGAQGPSSSNNKRKRSSPVAPSMDVDIMDGVLDDLNFDGDLPGLDQLDDLDFDLLGDS